MRSVGKPPGGLAHPWGNGALQANPGARIVKLAGVGLAAWIDGRTLLATRDGLLAAPHGLLRSWVERARERGHRAQEPERQDYREGRPGAGPRGMDFIAHGGMIGDQTGSNH